MTPLSDVIDVLRRAAGLGGQQIDGNMGYNMGNMGYMYAYNLLE